MNTPRDHTAASGYEAVAVLTFPTEDEAAARQALDAIEAWLDARTDVSASVTEFGERDA